MIWHRSPVGKEPPVADPPEQSFEWPRHFETYRITYPCNLAKAEARGCVAATFRKAFDHAELSIIQFIHKENDKPKL